MEQAIYRDYAWLYDIIYYSYLCNTVPRIIGFVEGVYRRESGGVLENILDLACGTGGPSILFAKRGYRVVGVDYNVPVLDIARRKASMEGIINVEFIASDMRDIVFKKEFDVATCFFTSINYIVDDDGIKALFNNVYESLKPGGLFIFDTPNILHPVMHKWAHGETIAWRVDYGGVNALVIDTVVLDNVTQLIDWNRTILVSRNGRVELIPDKHKLRGYTVNEIKLLASITGFREVVVYGGYSIHNRFPRTAPRLVFVLKK